MTSATEISDRIIEAVSKPASKGDDVGLRSFLLEDFHVCLAECLGNTLLADTLRDFTARTTLNKTDDEPSTYLKALL